MNPVHANVQTEAPDVGAAAPGGHERRERLQGTIDSLVRLRRDVVASYCRLAGIGVFDRRADARFRLAPGELVRFCETMVDYTAMGHFELYQRIIEGKERRRAVRETAADVYPALAEATDRIVDFNDRYETFEGSDDALAELAADLRELGDTIALRNQLEDQILAALSR